MCRAKSAETFVFRLWLHKTFGSARIEFFPDRTVIIIGFKLLKVVVEVCGADPVDDGLVVCSVEDPNVGEPVPAQAAKTSSMHMTDAMIQVYFNLNMSNPSLSPMRDRKYSPIHLSDYT